MGAIAAATRLAQVNQVQSLAAVKALMRIAVYNICFIRALFPNDRFEATELKNLDLTVNKLTPKCPESSHLLSWLEEGLFDALNKGFLQYAVFGISADRDGMDLLERYLFEFRNNDADGISIVISGMGLDDEKKQKLTKCTTTYDLTNQARKMIRILCELMKTLEAVPKERYLLMKLFYNSSAPRDYEPPFFRAATATDARWKFKRSQPFKMQSVLDSMDADCAEEKPSQILTQNVLDDLENAMGLTQKTLDTMCTRDEELGSFATTPSGFSVDERNEMPKLDKIDGDDHGVSNNIEAENPGMPKSLSQFDVEDNIPPSTSPIANGGFKASIVDKPIRQGKRKR